MPQRRHPGDRTVYKSIGLSPELHEWAAIIAGLGGKKHVAPVLVQCIQDGLLKILDDVSREADQLAARTDTVLKYRARVAAARIRPSPTQVDLAALRSADWRVLLEQIGAISGGPDGKSHSINAARARGEHAPE